MNGRNGQGPTGPGISLAELKDFPCDCGKNDWEPVRYVVYKVHRFRPEMQFRLVFERDKCSGCGVIREIKQT